MVACGGTVSIDRTVRATADAAAEGVREARGMAAVDAMAGGSTGTGGVALDAIAGAVVLVACAHGLPRTSTRIAAATMPTSATPRIARTRALRRTGAAA